MGAAEPEVGERRNADGTTSYNGRILAANIGVCMEERYQTAYNLGSGKVHWDGWVAVDLNDSADLRCDLRKLEIASGSADAVAAIHVLEHFYEWESHALITEWRRILKPGGRMILELPCLDKIFGYVVRCVQENKPMDMFMTLLPIYGDPKHKSVEMCHKWGYFTKPLIALLEGAGMREIVVSEPRYHFPFRDIRVECVK